MKNIFFVCFLILTSIRSGASAKPNEPAPINAPYDKVFDPWHACLNAETLAKRGAPDALRTIFLAAYVRLSQPFLGGEDLETMIDVMKDVLQSIGDRRFSLALPAQRPEVQSAVKYFCPDLKHYPRTKELLRSAPEIDWPLFQAYRNDR